MDEEILRAEIRMLILKNDKQLKHIKELRSALVENQEVLMIKGGMKIHQAKMRANTMYYRDFQKADREINSNKGSE